MVAWGNGLSKGSIMGKRKPVLGLDLDGVVVDFNGMWIRDWEECFDERHYVEDITDWDYRKKSVDMTGGEFWRWCKGVRLWRPDDVLVYEDNMTVARRLHKVYEIHVITSKPTWAKLDTVQWLVTSGIKFESLTFTRVKERVLCDVYVDDSPANLRALVAGPHPPYAPQPLVYRQRRPWNFEIPGTVGVDSLYELL